jgi:hypothetical protein
MLITSDFQKTKTPLSSPHTPLSPLQPSPMEVQLYTIQPIQLFDCAIPGPEFHITILSFHTLPVRPSDIALSFADARNQTPCTLPDIRSRTVSIFSAFPTFILAFPTLKVGNNSMCLLLIIGISAIVLNPGIAFRME